MASVFISFFSPRYDILEFIGPRVTQRKIDKSVKIGCFEVDPLQRLHKYFNT